MQSNVAQVHISGLNPGATGMGTDDTPAGQRPAAGAASGTPAAAVVAEAANAAGRTTPGKPMAGVAGGDGDASESGAMMVNPKKPPGHPQCLTGAKGKN